MNKYEYEIASVSEKYNPTSEERTRCLAWIKLADMYTYSCAEIPKDVFEMIRAGILNGGWPR